MADTNVIDWQRGRARTAPSTGQSHQPSPSDLVTRLMPKFQTCPVTTASGLVGLIRQAENGELPEQTLRHVWTVVSGLMGVSTASAPAVAHAWSESVGPFVTAMLMPQSDDTVPTATVRAHLAVVR